MKKLHLIILTLTALLLSSCEKESVRYKINNTQLNIRVGERYQFVITKGEVKSKVEHFDWISSDVNIGDVNGSGQAFGKKMGNFTVTVIETATLETIAKCDVTVNDKALIR